MLQVVKYSRSLQSIRGDAALEHSFSDKSAANHHKSGQINHDEPDIN
ncbi:Uncharacterised protein [Yersinia rohdei]|nr:Uncharacterised protein [Yersinia rohdei]